MLSDIESAPRRRWSRTGAILFTLVLLLLFALTASGQRVLVLGVDEAPDDLGRSDTMMVLSPRPFHGGLKLLSIPRDTRVEIPGHGVHRINSALPWGGPELTRAVVEALLGLRVHHYVRVDLLAVKSVVDTVGGVTLEVDRRMVYSDPHQDLHIDLQPGVQRLNGDQALQFIRFRGDPDGDISRVARQQRFVQALLRELVNPLNWHRLPGAYLAFHRHAETTMSVPALFRFGLALALSTALGVDGETVPGRPANIGGLSFWLHDEEETAEVVAALFGWWSVR